MRRGAATWLVGDARQSISATTTSTTVCVERGRERGAVRSASEAQRQRNGDERRASGTTSSRVHFARGGLVCDECRGRRTAALVAAAASSNRDLDAARRNGVAALVPVCAANTRQSLVVVVHCLALCRRRRRRRRRPERRLQCAVLNADSAPACCVGSSAAWCVHHPSTSQQQQQRRRASSCAACSNRWRPPSRTPSSARRCTISPVKFKFDEVGARPCTSTPTPTRTALGDGGSAMELGAKFNSNALLIGVLLLKCRPTSLIAACRSSSVHVAVRHALAADGRRVRQRHSLRRPSLASW